MRVTLTGFLLAATIVAALAPAAEAKKFRYASGPKPPADSTLSVANPYLEPVVRAVGPRVPYTNLQLTAIVADSAAARTVGKLPLDAGSHVVLAPAHEHTLNFVLEHAMLTALTRRGVSVTVRHSPVPDDSVSALYANPGDPLVEYTLGSAKTSYLRLVGWLPGRVKIERQSLVQGSVALRDPTTSRVLWSGDLAQNFIDRFPKGQSAIVEDGHYAELKDEVPTRNIDKVAEPVIVVGIISGLIALFFQNRP